MKRLSGAICFATGVLLAAGVLALLAGNLSDGTGAGSGMRTVPSCPAVQCRLVERHTIEYLQLPFDPVEKAAAAPVRQAKLRHFGSRGELEEWLAEAASATAVYLQPPGGKVDCDDYALALQSRALSGGFILSFEIITRDEYNALFGGRLPPGQDFHAVNLAVIGNDVWYIEPQTGEVVFALCLD